ncbi:hypothetical protein NDA11_004809 [Ustilago hordei]|nr:hypothetical protein NDA12_003994 [Ustilago hordei]KAJ1578382.1 hypothetical protein NDA11_004809 [Ustilago hordei]KAJ1592441.1 hypothetical protein NDA15_002342 [Ustilago hordei]KAJ1595868.1 hypothetical protein NDA14_005406 [Ustilago hordei]
MPTFLCCIHHCIESLLHWVILYPIDDCCAWSLHLTPVLPVHPSDPMTVAQLVYEDRLPLHDLGKLCNPAKVPTLKETELGVLVNGVCVMVPKPATVASSSKIFLHLLPNVHSFAQAWTVYMSLCCTYTNDPHLSASLCAFLVHVIDLDITFLWPAIVEYMLAICCHHFGFTTTSDWVVKDLDAWQEELGGAPQCSIQLHPSTTKTTTTPSQLPLGPKGLCTEPGIQASTPSRTALNLWPRRPPPSQHGQSQPHPASPTLRGDHVSTADTGSAQLQPQAPSVSTADSGLVPPTNFVIAAAADPSSVPVSAAD